MREIFCEHESQYNLRNSKDFPPPRIKTVIDGLEAIRFGGSQVWATVPKFIIDSTSLTEFKNRINFSLEKRATADYVKLLSKT